MNKLLLVISLLIATATAEKTFVVEDDSITNPIIAEIEQYYSNLLAMPELKGVKNDDDFIYDEFKNQLSYIELLSKREGKQFLISALKKMGRIKTLEIDRVVHFAKKYPSVRGNFVAYKRRYQVQRSQITEKLADLEKVEIIIEHLKRDTLVVK